MNFSLKLLFILTLSFFVCSCSSNDSNSKERSNNSSSERQPEFLDGGKTVDNLKRTYNCQSIEYENWEDGDATDSSLTICFINSNKVPSGNADGGYNQLKEIALQIKKSVAKPENYNSYYVIFVKTDTVNGVVSKSHTAGTDIPSKNL